MRFKVIGRNVSADDSDWATGGVGFIFSAHENIHIVSLGVTLNYTVVNITDASYLTYSTCL